jgi:hypothetical protein
MKIAEAWSLVCQTVKLRGRTPAARLGVQVRTEASVTPLGGSPMDCRSAHRYGLTRLAKPLRTGRWHFELFLRAWLDDQESHGFLFFPCG